MNEPYTKYEDNNKIVIMNPYSQSWIRLSKGRYLYYQNHQDEFKAQLEKHGMLLDKKLLDKVDIKSIYFAVTRKCNMSRSRAFQGLSVNLGCLGHHVCL